VSGGWGNRPIRPNVVTSNMSLSAKAIARWSHAGMGPGGKPVAWANSSRAAALYCRLASRLGGMRIRAGREMQHCKGVLMAARVAVRGPILILTLLGFAIPVGFAMPTLADDLPSRSPVYGN